MSTFLQICKDVNRLAGMQGSFDSVSSASGYQLTLATMVQKAWTDIQNLRKDWDFLRTSETFTTTASQSEYTISNIFGTSVSPVGNWKTDMILYAKDSDNHIPMRQYDYDYYKVSTVDQGTASEPSVFAIDPIDKHLYFNNIDATYTIIAHYYQKPQVLDLTDNNDTPLAPSEFHTAITYRALADFTFFMGDLDKYEKASQQASTIMGSLMRDSIPSRKIQTLGIA